MPLYIGEAMLPIRNNPIYSNSNLLYDDSNRSPGFRCSPLVYSPFSGRPQSRPSIVSEDASSSNSFTFPSYVAVNDQFQGSLPTTHTPMNFMPLDYCSYPLPNHNPRVPQRTVSYNTLDTGFGAYPTCPSIPEAVPTDGLMDLWEVSQALLTAQQPPSMAPTVPEELPPHPLFGSHQCGWLSGPPCNGIAPGKNREMAEHLRVCHHFIGHERDVVNCEWVNCGQTMQRMNVPRHIVSRHLLAAAECRICGKRFSRPDVVSRHEKTCGKSPTGTSSRKPQKLAGRSCDF